MRKVTKAIKEIPQASPSKPSIKLIVLVIPTIHIILKGSATQPKEKTPKQDFVKPQNTPIEENTYEKEIPKIKGIENLQKEEIIPEKEPEFKQEDKEEKFDQEKISSKKEIEKSSGSDEEFDEEPEFNKEQENKVLDIF